MIYEIIEKELKKTSESRYSIAKKLGIQEASLCRIYHRQQKHTRTDIADKLLIHFGYEVRKAKK